MDHSALIVVLPIPHCENEKELLQFLKSYGDCVTWKEARSGAKKAILVGKIVREWKFFRDPNGDDKKAYHLESVAVGDSSIYRFVASGRRLVSLLDEVFSAGTGDYLALYEPQIMENTADLPTVYFPHKKAMVWVCKTRKKKVVKNIFERPEFSITKRAGDGQ